MNLIELLLVEQALQRSGLTRHGLRWFQTLQHLLLLIGGQGRRHRAQVGVADPGEQNSAGSHADHQRFCLTTIEVVSELGLQHKLPHSEGRDSGKNPGLAESELCMTQSRTLYPDTT